MNTLMGLWRRLGWLAGDDLAIWPHFMRARPASGLDRVTSRDSQVRSRYHAREWVADVDRSATEAPSVGGTSFFGVP